MFIAKIIMKLLAKFRGEDILGNRYYEKGKRRFVEYANSNDPAQIPPIWHAWLHKARHLPPKNNEAMYEWQIKAEPNQTGTKKAYYPTVNEEKSYERWVPK